LCYLIVVCWCVWEIDEVYFDMVGCISIIIGDIIVFDFVIDDMYCLELEEVIEVWYLVVVYDLVVDESVVCLVNVGGIE